MPSLIDSFFIILFVITVSVIIGLSIVNVVDKKLSNVSINIPPVKIPETKIVVNICESSKRKLDVNAKSIIDNDTNININNNNAAIVTNGATVEVSKDIAPDAATDDTAIINNNGNVEMLY